MFLPETFNYYGNKNSCSLLTNCIASGSCQSGESFFLNEEDNLILYSNFTSGLDIVAEIQSDIRISEEKNDNAKVDIVTNINIVGGQDDNDDIWMPGVNLTGLNRNLKNISQNNENNF